MAHGLGGLNVAERSTLRIGINALFLIPGKVGGTEVYTRNLVKGFTEVDPSNEYVVFANRESKGVFDSSGPGVEVVDCPVRAESRPRRLLWEQFILPVRARQLGLDVLFSAGMTCPFVSPVKQVLVVHDLQHVNQPQNFAWYYLPFLKFFIYMSSKRAERIVTISKHVKRQIEDFYRIPPEKVHVVYNAVDTKRFARKSPEEVRVVRERYDLPEMFILYAASTLPHKNHPRLLEAFKKVREKHPSVKLVLTGARGQGREAVERKITELGLESSVVFLGWLPFEDLPAIYSASEAFVFPSLHEGFGIPLVEAMAAGTPVVCSGIEPLTEVAGDAACFIDPTDARDIASGIMKVLEDRGLREGLVRKGLQRAGKFSWETTARETLSILKSCVEGRR